MLLIKQMQNYDEQVNQAKEKLEWKSNECFNGKTVLKIM